MSDPIVQTMTDRQREQERLQQEAYTADRERRAEVLADQQRVQDARAAERAALMDAPVVPVALGFAVVRRETWTGSVTIEKTGAGVATLIIDGQRIDALDVPDFLIRLAEKQTETAAAAPVVTQGFRSRTPKQSA
jgi:hypothetical protein